MSDLETLKAMLDRAGVPYSIAPPKDDVREPNGPRLTIVVDKEHVVGYSGFATTWQFDERGALVYVEVYE